MLARSRKIGSSISSSSNCRIGIRKKSSSLLSSSSSSLPFQQIQQQRQNEEICYTAAKSPLLLSSSKSQMIQKNDEINRLYMMTTRVFSTDNKEAKKEDKQKDGEKVEETTDSNSSDSGDSLRDAVNRLKGKGGLENEEGSSSSSSSTSEPLFSTSSPWLQSFQEQIKETWKDLLRAGEPKSINKKILPKATAEGEAPYTGPVDIMVIDPKENLTAWERMQKRLTEAPIIQDILFKGEEVFEKSGAKKVKQKVDHVVEDAKEVWETSQNPWIYRMSSVYDTMTAETEESVAVSKLRVLDPEFTLEGWRHDVVELTLPQIMEWFLQGKINQLKPWLGEGVFKRIAAEITARKQEGVQIDTHVLGIMNSEILACELDQSDKSASPIIVLHFMCQQINCVRKKKTGEIVEGSEDDIRANSYVAAFQRTFDEENGELVWKIVDFRFNGAIAYI